MQRKVRKISDYTAEQHGTLKQSLLKQQLVYWHWPLLEFPKQGVLFSAFWMAWISSAFFILPQFIPSFFAFFFMSSIFIFASLRYFNSIVKTPLAGTLQYINFCPLVNISMPKPGGLFIVPASRYVVKVIAGFIPPGSTQKLSPCFSPIAWPYTRPCQSGL